MSYETLQLILRWGVIPAAIFFYWIQMVAKKKNKKYEYSIILQILGPAAWPVMIPLFCLFSVISHTEKVKAEASNV